MKTTFLSLLFTLVSISVSATELTQDEQREREYLRAMPAEKMSECHFDRLAELSAKLLYSTKPIYMGEGSKASACNSVKEKQKTMNKKFVVT